MIENRIGHHDALTVAAPAPEAPRVEKPPTFLAFEAKTEKQRHAAELIEQGVERLVADPEGFFRFRLDFHDYSINNRLLIWMQHQDATLCASKDTWAKKGRTVRPEWAHRGPNVFFPLFRRWKSEDPDTGEEVVRKTLTGFGVGRTYDVSMTEGREIPDQPTIVERLGVTDASMDVDRGVSRYLEDEGLRLAKLPLGAARGIYSPTNGLVAVNQDLPFGDILTTKTLMHEAAHYAGDHRGVADKRDTETVAEASAFIAMNHFGMDTGGYSFHYVAHWAEDMTRLRQNLGAAQKIAGALIQAVKSGKGRQ